MIKPYLFTFFCSFLLLLSCKEKTKSSAGNSPDQLPGLKRGNVIACGPPEKEFGSVNFASTCSAATQKDFNMAVALLHSFEYDESEKLFAKIIDSDPGCTMAYWGVAMSNYHQVWPSPPLQEELEKGAKAISIAQTMPQRSKKETDYIKSIAVFYKDWSTTDHRTRVLNYYQAMDSMYRMYPGDKEVAVFYALALVGSADASDKTYSKQKQAAAILLNLYPGEPNHPGIVHYIIHSYDSPELAPLALPAAVKYAAIAPSSAHAQHMPSHIFIRLGLWDQSISSNLVAAASAKCYAESSGIRGHWDEELHAIDYLVYAYLQKGRNDLAKEQVDYLHGFTEVSPVNFKVLYAFAASPSRYYLENKLWKEAAEQELQPGYPWEKYPWQEAIVHFTRLLGAAHSGHTEAAKKALKELEKKYEAILAQKDNYKANQVMIQMETGKAWITFAEGKKQQAIQQMSLAADMEDKTEKSPVTPGEVLPAKQLLGDMLMESNEPAKALTAYEADIQKHPNRFNSVYGAGLAAERTGNKEKAVKYYRQLLTFANPDSSSRPELALVKTYLNKK